MTESDPLSLIADSLSPEDRDIYIRYLQNPFGEPRPPEGDAFLAPWEKAVERAALCGAAEVINSSVTPRRPVDFVDPEGLSLEIYPSFAGRIPVITARDVRDFEQLEINLVYKGVRPEGLEKAGAAFLCGRTVRLILLSAKPYSNVPAEELGLSPEAWARSSMVLRREHECLHYYTRRRYGTSANRLYDELLADYAGMQAALGKFSAELFLRFMGRAGGRGRLDLYIPNGSPALCAALEETARICARSLEEISRRPEFIKLSREEQIRALCVPGLRGLAEGSLTAVL